MSDSKFDSQWSSLAKDGVEALYIEDDNGQGLMGNVRRATTLPAEAAAAMPAWAADPNAPLPQQPWQATTCRGSSSRTWPR